MNDTIENIRTQDEPLEKCSWYAAKVFFNKTVPFAKVLDEMSIQYYIPSSVITSLAFFRCTHNQARQLQYQRFSQIYVYTRSGSRDPFPIPDREMEVFIFVTSANDKDMLLLGDDRPEYHLGDRVRVTEGPFKGAEGHVKRIKKDRRLVVTIPGVVAVATAFIPPQFLEKIDS